MISTIHNVDICDTGKKDKNGNAISQNALLTTTGI
mgnify:CR=1 FL=1